MEVKIVNKSKYPLPEYKTDGSAGVDLIANLTDDIVLESLERALIPTGLFVEIPAGYEIQIRARSGLSIKEGLTLINAVGTIDSDYRGEIKIPIVNLSNKTARVHSGDRIAQMILAKYERIDFKLVESIEELEETTRGKGGFGHTGI